MTRFEILSVHFTNECNMNCPFCYRREERLAMERLATVKKDRGPAFFLDMANYISELAPIVAYGGGEPLTDTDFIRCFSAKCHENDLRNTFTTNGRRFMEMPLDDIKDTLAYTDMVSISYDSFKYPPPYGAINYEQTVARVRKAYSGKVGTNLLVEEPMIDNQKVLAAIVIWLFEKVGVDQVVALHPKQVPFVRISGAAPAYYWLTNRYKNFGVDDLTNQIFEQGYGKWEKPCHFSRDMVSIDQAGYVSGCSFEKNKIMKIEEAKDVLKLKDLPVTDRYECPFLVLKSE